MGDAESAAVSKLLIDEEALSRLLGDMGALSRLRIDIDILVGEFLRETFGVRLGEAEGATVLRLRIDEDVLL
jgi:hypothetical protein